MTEPRPVKTDQNDARGLAEMVWMGWYREVKVKTFSAHEQCGLRALARINLAIDWESGLGYRRTANSAIGQCTCLGLQLNPIADGPETL
jgi:hypothetical protein